MDCPYGIDNEQFAARADAAAPRRARLRRDLGVPPDAVCFLFVGKLEPKKRVLDAIDAMAGAPSAAHLLVVGHGAEAARARVRARGRAVSFAGFVNQGALPEVYHCADCLVLPSDHRETWGLVVNEAMACARPAVVGDRVGCEPDLVLPGETGWVFPSGDVKALAGALVRAARAIAAPHARVVRSAG